MKIQISFACALGAVAAFAAAPQATVTGFTQAADRTVTISYSLANGPAVVTLSVETNGPSGWSAIDGSDLRIVKGDVFRRVSASTGTIRWTPDHAALKATIAAGKARAKLTAWTLDDTPDYMVVTLVKDGFSATADRIRYHTSTNEFPGGLLDNSDYRISKLVMKRVRARGIPWTMGSTWEVNRNAPREKPHRVVLDHDYYLGVFPMTVGQLSAIRDAGMTLGFHVDRAMRVADRVYYSKGFEPIMRDSNWPAAPAEGTILDRLRKLTVGEIDDWDLPTEAEWEFAAKAGQLEGHWGDGSEHKLTANDVNHDDNLPGRYRYNQESDWWQTYQDFIDSASVQPVGNGCPIAGSYRPNAWGFYDMHGGIWEWCLDWYGEDITALGGRVNIDPEDGSKLADGTTAGSHRCQRGGCYHNGAHACRAAYRGDASPTYPGDSAEGGARVACRAGLR